MTGPGGKQLYKTLLVLIVSSRGFILSPLPKFPPFSCPAFTFSTDSWVTVFQLHPLVSNPSSVTGFPSILSLLSKDVSHHTHPPQPHWDLAFWTSNCHPHHSGPPYPEPSCPVFTLPSVTSILLGPPKENLSLRGFLEPRPSDSKSLDADCCLPDPPAVDCQILGGRGGFSLKSDPQPAGAWHRGGAQAGGHRQGRLCHRKRVSGKNGKS